MNTKIIVGILLVATAVVLISQTQTHHDDFSAWKAQHGIIYSAQENIYRANLFAKTLDEINHHNSLLGSSYKLGLNKFSALSDEEFAKMYLMAPINVSSSAVQLSTEVGADIDWQAYGAVSPVRDQGSVCLSSYVFSANGAIEAKAFITKRIVVILSIQQVVDCSQSYGNNGCNGGRMDNTFLYARNIGLNTDSAYPYVGALQTCRVGSGPYQITGYVNVTQNSCLAIDNALSLNPVSVVVDGTNMRSYSMGVFTNCGTALTLPVLLTGSTNAYYRARNSWGTGWGQNGYVRVSKSNGCGICGLGSYPII